MSNRDVEWQTSLTDIGIIQQSGPEQRPSKQTRQASHAISQYRLHPKSTAKSCKCDWVQVDSKSGGVEQEMFTKIPT